MNIDAEMTDALDRLEQLLDRLPSVADEMTKADAAFARKWAESRVNYRTTQVKSGKKYTISEVDDHATLDTIDEKVKRDLSAEMLRVARDEKAILIAKLEALRTLSADRRVGV